MKKLLFLFFLFFTLVGFGQRADQSSSSEGNQSFHRTEVYGGVFLHTNGLGVSFRKAERLTGYSKRIFGIDVLNMKHAKEVKSFNPYYEDNRGFVFGKLNSVLVARPSIGFQKIMFTKDAKKGVQISYMIFGAPSISFLKPVYLEISDPSSGSWSNSRRVERFDPEKHSYDNILGRASLLRGIEETTLRAGLHAKFAFNFEYSTDDDLLRALETGISFDGYLRPLPIMAYETNRRIYLTLFLNFHFGRKYL